MELEINLHMLNKVKRTILKQVLSFFINVEEFNIEKVMVSVEDTQFKVLSSLLLSNLFKV